MIALEIGVVGLLVTVLLVLLWRKDIVRGWRRGRSRGYLDADAAAWKDPAVIRFGMIGYGGLTLRARVEDRRTTAVPA